jgi:hypothetical protein
MSCRPGEVSSESSSCDARAAQEPWVAAGEAIQSPMQRPTASLIVSPMTVMIMQQIEKFRCPGEALFAEHRGGGYTLYDMGSGAPAAPRARPGTKVVLY